MLQHIFRNSMIKVHVYIIKEYHENPVGTHQGMSLTFNLFPIQFERNEEPNQRIYQD